ncbi:MAG: chromate transporter [Ruminococcaceae bacterium]|nr:chromate transporter [Oscillospiraceae bacterium]
MKKLLNLFFIFAKIGVVAFGGGYVILPLLKREFAEKRSWVTEEEIMDYFAISQCTPGVIAVNSATFIGRRNAGTLGAIFATLGVVFPSLIIISVLALFLQNFAEITMVKYALSGIRACVCALILSTVISLVKKSVIDKISCTIAIVVFLLMCMFDISPIIFVISAGVLGVVVSVLRKRGAVK